MRLSKVGVFLLVLTLVFTTGCIFGKKEYIISGTVLDENNKPIENVVIKITGDTTATVENFDKDGKWSATVKGKVTVAPVHEFYQFDPEARDVSKKTDKLDFKGKYVKPYNISGTVLDNDKVIEGVVIKITGDTTAEVKDFDKDGKWSATVKGKVTVTPYHELYGFEPKFKEVSSAADNLNFQGTLLGAYNISGIVLDLDGKPISDTIIKITGQVERDITVDETGKWEANDVRGEIVVSPIKEGVKFNTEGLTITEANNNINFVGTNPLVWYKFGEIEGTTVTDFSASGNDATLEGGAIVNDGILSLDGVDGYVNLPEGLLANLDNFSISFSVNVKELRPWSRLFDFAGPFGFVYMTPQGIDGITSLTVFTNQDSISGEDIFSDFAIDPIATDTWVLVTVVFSNKEISFYYDGNLISVREAHAQPKDVGSTFHNYIGKSIFEADQYLLADFKEFCIYNQALTADQIADLYSLGK